MIHTALELDRLAEAQCIPNAVSREYVRISPAKSPNARPTSYTRIPWIRSTDRATCSPFGPLAFVEHPRKRVQLGREEQVTSKQGLLRGPKFNMRHTTIIESALPFVQMLKASPAVKKISLGVIKPITSGGPRKGGSHQVKALLLPRAVRFSFRGGSSVQQFHVFGPDLNAIANLVEDWS